MEFKNRSLKVTDMNQLIKTEETCRTQTDNRRITNWRNEAEQKTRGNPL